MRVGLAGGSPLLLRLRRRPGPRPRTAARLPGQAARALYDRGHPPRVCHRKVVRAAVHGGLRPLHFLHGSLARSADHSRRGSGGRSGGDQVAVVSWWLLVVGKTDQPLAPPSPLIPTYQAVGRGAPSPPVLECP